VIFGGLQHLGDLAAMFDVKRTEIAGDVERCAATRRTLALFPTGLVAQVHGAVGALHQPSVGLALAGFCG